MTTYVSNRNSGETDEQGHYRFQTKVWQGNVLSGLAVVQNSPLARNVLVPAGDLKIDYSEYAYTAWNDADVVVAISTADTSNPRIDRIIAYIDRAAALGTTNNPSVLKFVAVDGTPAGSPVKASDATVNTAVGATNPWCELATVRVEANATTIPNSKITDTRTLIYLRDETIPTNALRPGVVTNSKVTDVGTEKLSNPYKFSAYRAAAWTVGNAGYARVDFDTEDFDTGSNYDAVTNFRFTAPVAGFYHFEGIASFVLAANSLGQVSLYKNSALIKRGNQVLVGGAAVNFGGAAFGTLQLAANDYVEIAAYGSGGAGGVTDATHFAGYLISKT